MCLPDLYPATGLFVRLLDVTLLLSQVLCLIFYVDVGLCCFVLNQRLFIESSVLRVFVEIGVMRAAYPRQENVASNKKVLIIRTESWYSSGV